MLEAPRAEGGQVPIGDVPEGAAAVLAGPRYDHPRALAGVGGVIERPSGDSGGLALRLAYEGRPGRGELHAELIGQDLGVTIVYGQVAGGAVYTGGGHEAASSWSGSREMASPRGHFLCIHNLLQLF